MTTVVRRGDPDDVAAVRRIAERGWIATYEDLLSRETIESALKAWYDPERTRAAIERDDGACFVAERNGTVLGYVNGGLDEERTTATLGAIYVDPDHWGEGIGTTLLSEFEECCRQHGCDTIQVRVLVDNAVGMSFYRKQGYEVVEERTSELFGETIDEYELRKALE